MEIPAEAFSDNHIDVFGALDFDQRPNGISPRRLPDWTRPQIPPMLDIMARMPSGVRLRFATDSKEVRLRCLTTQMVESGGSPTPVNLNLETADGELMSQSISLGNVIYFDPRVPGKFHMERGEPEEVVFSGLSGDRQDLQLWLPHGAYVELHAISVDDGSELSAFSRQQPRWVHYGSSISHCMEAEQPALTWPAVAARLGGVELVNLGVGGQCHVDQFIARTIRELSPDYISAKLGINVVNADSMRERVFVPAVHGFLDTIRERCQTTPILLVSPIFCPAAENAPGPTWRNDDGRFGTRPRDPELNEGALSLTRIRDLLQDIVSAREDPALYYLSGLSLFSEEDAGDLPDDLHPNAAGYIRMGSRFAAQVFAPSGTLGPK